MIIDEQASRAEWDEALRQGYKGTYAEWRMDRQDWIDFRAEFLAGEAGTDDFYVWKKNKKKVLDFELSFATAKEMGFKGTRDQWAKFVNTLRGPSAYDIWMVNNSENIQDIFGKESISEKEWSDLLFSTKYMHMIASEHINKNFREITPEEIDKLIDSVLAEKEE